MKYEELQRSHDAMADYLRRLLEFSDDQKVKRTPTVEKHYQEALRLVRQAGWKYTPREDRRNG